LEYRCLKSIPENLLSQQQKLHRKTTEGDIRTHFKCSVPNFLKNAIIGRKRTEGEKNFNSQSRNRMERRGGSISISVVILEFFKVILKDHRSTRISSTKVYSLDFQRRKKVS